jgi:hypothetical protein
VIALLGDEIFETDLTFIITAVSASFLLSIEVLMLLSDKKEKKDYQIVIKDVNNTITDGFCDGTMWDKTTIKRLFEVNKLNESFDSLADFLDNYLNSLLRWKDNRIQYEVEGESADKKVSYKKINDFLTSIIQKEREEKPFEGVEERVRKLLQDIDKASKEQNPDAVSSNLNYLANIMIENQKIYSKENRRNNLLSRIGVICTILGLIAAIIIFVIQNNKSLTGEVVKQKMIEVVDSSVVIDTNNIVDYRLEFGNF